MCKFYSPGWLGDLVAATLQDLPATIVDLGSGPGSLGHAARLRWPHARLTTVDIDPDASAFTPDRHCLQNHVARNVLIDGLARALGVELGSVDVVLSNPPYTRVRRTRSITRVLERAGLAEAVAGWSTIPADLVFLAQALLLTRPGGTVAFVVPDTMISSETMASVRRLLIGAHKIELVIQLPRSTFGRTDALAFVIVIKKSALGGPIRLAAVGDAGLISTRVTIQAPAGVQRLDCLYHAAVQPDPSRASLADLGANVSRGRRNSRDVATSSKRIFHTGDFPDRPGAAIVVSCEAVRSGATRDVLAEPGDILMARVDRRLERKICFVREGAVEISDCVLRLRLPELARERALSGLLSEEGQIQIMSTIRGTGARHISARALLSIRV
nr:N-6 DNA methylase [Sphingomonas sp. TREG-RG-20F-R18-01]